MISTADPAPVLDAVLTSGVKITSRIQHHKAALSGRILTKERLRRSFNRKLRDECLNEEVFATLAEARVVIERWRHDYNHIRPHSAHGGLTPEAVRLNHAAGRLRNLEGSADRPLPPASEISYQTPGLSQ